MPIKLNNVCAIVTRAGSVVYTGCYMRVLYVVESTIAGVRTHVQNLATGLDRHRFQVVVACPLRRQQSFGDDQFVSYLTRAGISVVPVAMRRTIDLAGDLAALRQLIGLMRRERFDLIHLHSSKAGFLGRLAARSVAGTPVVYSPHGLFFLADHTRAKRRFYLALEQFAAHLCDRVIATSPSERATIIEHRIAPPHKVVCIEYGIAVDQLPSAAECAERRRALGMPLDAPLIGTVARIAAQKNPQLFVDAAARVLQQLPDAHMIWCGDGELRAEAEARAQANGIADHCHFLGHREDAAAVLATFDLFWLTSDYESFGMATAEAMALERPVVATDVVGTRDVVVSGYTGVLVPPRNPRALADATLALLHDRDYARALGRHGRARAIERYTIERMIRETTQLYDTVRQARPARRAEHRATP
jgi:glycosyltransferase involved in cell wall biosynthesis